MNFSQLLPKNIQKDIKKTFKKGVNKFLSSEVQQELGLKKIRTGNPEMDIHDFWVPVQSNLLSDKKREKYSTWIVGIVVALIVLLFVLIFSLVSPNAKSYSTDGDTVVIVNGETASLPQEKEGKKPAAEEDKTVEDMTSEDIRIENIQVKPDGAKDIVANSPLLNAEGSVMEYKVKSGDTIEKIAVKFYGEYNYQLIKKIKLANNINNARSLQIGQKLIIPFN